VFLGCSLDQTLAVGCIA